MTSFVDRLRGVIRPPDRHQSDGESAGHHLDESVLSATQSDAADVLGGEWCGEGGQRFLVVERRYPPGHRHGHVAVADCLPPDDGIWPRLPLLLGRSSDHACRPLMGRLLFLDLETTGLAGGAGTYAFLVGCGWFDGGCFRVRQLFLSGFLAERVLLEALSAIADECACVVTYNGKSFDLPLIETRYSMQRMATPFAGLPHVDMLHPARRLWREDEVECRLTNLERSVNGHEREDDVPGFEVPARYFRYVRSGDASPLEGVLEHNRRDILSLAMLTARASQLLADGAGAAATQREAFGMGCLYERAGQMEEALAAFARASDSDLPPAIGGRGPGEADGIRTDALRRHAMVCRRLRRFDQAAETWRRLLDLGPRSSAIVREATEALAIHHEHRRRDLLAARSFASRALQVEASAVRRQAVEYRLARLDRKLGAAVAKQSTDYPLFPLV